MKKNHLGRTGIEVTELSCGTLILGRLQADMTPEESAPALAKALELGINFFDTAQAYGSQGHLRIGLGSARNDVVIATKTHARTADDARKALEESLRELGRGHIDIYHLHLIDGPGDLEERRGVLEFLLECKEKGLVRAVGASVHKVAAAKVVAEEPGFDVLFPILNSGGLGIADGTGEEMLAASRTARANGKGVYAMEPLGGGHLRQDPEKAFRFLRSLGVADSICVGMKSPAEVEMNVALFEGREVSKELRGRVETVPRGLKIYESCHGCGACVETCSASALTLDLSRADESKKKKGQAVVDRAKCILCGYCAEVCPQFALRVV
jgi:aryl-alcohol dehydrogenase-like predicted oxidoreductase